jgi:hypothetical protein
MRAQLVLVIIAAAAMSSCTTEDYYRSANRSPILHTSINLDATDTIKTSGVSQQRTYILPIEAADENGNINLLTTFADGGETRILDGLGEGAIENIELAKERYAFTRQVEFVPTSDGRHTINTRVRDDFGNVTSMEKQVYSFTNMRPKLKVGHYAQRHDKYQVIHYFDYSTSFDRDERWGGEVDSLFFLGKCMPYINGYPEDIEGGIFYESYKVNRTITSDYIDKYIVNTIWWDEDFMDRYWMTDIYVWIKDNENMPSDTVHISLGHIEQNLPRKEYEGR